MALRSLHRAVNAIPSALGCRLSFSPGRSIVAVHTHRHAHFNVGQGNPFINVSEEVREAIENRKPVVALETTIYTHGGYNTTYRCSTQDLILRTGFPYPENVALASHLESIVRVNGGIPATIGVLNGVARVGLAAEELIELTASAGKSDTKKISRRDLAFICGLVIPSIQYCPCNHAKLHTYRIELLGARRSKA